MELPLFPLHTVLFPGRRLPLHVFEPRYQAMLAECEANGRRFGVTLIRRGHEVGEPAEVYAVGTIAKIEQVRHLGDGRADVVVRGVERFRVVERLPEDPYPRARVELLDEPRADRHAMRRSIEVRELLAPYLCRLGAPEELIAHLPVDPIALSYFAAASLQTDLPEQQELLELEGVDRRLAAVQRLLHRESELCRHLGVVGWLKPAGPNGAQLN